MALFESNNNKHGIVTFKLYKKLRRSSVLWRLVKRVSTVVETNQN